MEGADLRGANLRGANLRNVCLAGAKMEGALVTEEQLARTWGGPRPRLVAEEPAASRPAGSTPGTRPETVPDEGHD